MTENSIRPFTIDIPQSDLDDLRERLERTRWPDELPDVGWRYGVPLSYLKELAEYWRTSYDWRKHEALLNEHPQFMTTIDGTRVHFMHVRSPEDSALPVVMTHGWPGSIVEFLDVIGPLTDPASHGGAASDAFHLVMPSIPGYGVSGPTNDTGWDHRRVAGAFAELMSRLGYEHYGVQGGDWGAAISQDLAVMDPEHVIGAHINMFGTRPPPDADDLTDEERARVERAQQFQRDGWGYGWIQGTRPQTLAYGLTDSPVGLLAWILEKFRAWTDCGGDVFSRVSRDTLLTNVTIYWATGAINSSFWPYYWRRHERWPIGRDQRIAVPTAYASFPKEILHPPRAWAERVYDIRRWTVMKSGGHFAALEEPAALAADIAEFFRPLR